VGAGRISDARRLMPARSYRKSQLHFDSLPERSASQVYQRATRVVLEPGDALYRLRVISIPTGTLN
jgi:hypothetical protein